MRIVLLVASILALSKADDNIFSVDKKAQKFCGPGLRIAVKLVCDSIYKRSSPDSMPMREDWMMNFLRLDEPKTDFPFRSRTKALAILPELFQRQTRGIVDECCNKACSYDEMKTYCG